MKEEDLNKMDADSFTNATKIPPAFAGLLVDWKIGAKEITATIVDLIVKDYLAVSGDIIFKTEKTIGLKEFEKEFIEKIFSDKKSLKFKEVENIAYHKNNEDLIKIIFKALTEQKIINNYDEKKVANALKKSLKENFGLDPALLKNTKVMVAPAWISKISLKLIKMNPMFSEFENEFQKNMEDSIIYEPLTTLGKKYALDSLMLKKFMEKYPMLEDRIANELVGHAIAFGIGKKWMKKLGGKKAELGNMFEEFYGVTKTMTYCIDLKTLLKELQD